MFEFLIPSDLDGFVEDIEVTKAQTMIADAHALAALAAPCLNDPDRTLTEQQIAAVRAILRGAIVRWHESGSGALQAESIGSYSYTVDARAPRRGLFWPSEIEQLRSICADADAASGAFAIDTVSWLTPRHADICALRFGALYCSCGAVLSGAEPLWEETL